MLRRALALSLFALACEEAPRAVPDASVRPPPKPPAAPEEGCARTGNVDALAADPACVVPRPSEEAMRAALKKLAITTALESAEVFAGGSTTVTVTIQNTSSEPVLVVLEARSRPAGPRPDWSRVAGVPSARLDLATSPKLFFAITTTDSHDREVDALPTIGTPTAAPTPIGTLLKPGGKLTHSASWWALGIPAPAPMFQDDAGHRYYPKTTAIPLYPGEYNVVVDVPIYGLSREERKFATRVRVRKAPPLDGGG
jgi:hypothetical protein